MTDQPSIYQEAVKWVVTFSTRLEQCCAEAGYPGLADEILDAVDDCPEGEWNIEDLVGPVKAEVFRRASDLARESMQREG